MTEVRLTLTFDMPDEDAPPDGMETMHLTPDQVRQVLDLLLSFIEEE